MRKQDRGLNIATGIIIAVTIAILLAAASGLGYCAYWVVTLDVEHIERQEAYRTVEAIWGEDGPTVGGQ